MACSRKPAIYLFLCFNICYICDNLRQSLANLVSRMTQPASSCTTATYITVAVARPGHYSDCVQALTRILLFLYAGELALCIWQLDSYCAKV